jgi:hypothetical protein
MMLMMLTRALAQDDSMRIVSVHAVELVPLLKAVENVGGVSVNLDFIRLQGEEQGHMLFPIAVHDDRLCIICFG